MDKSRKAAILALGAFGLLVGMTVQAQEAGAEAENMIELFVGVTHDDDETEPSLGVTYERKFGRFGTGVIVEFTKADRRETILALPFFWHPAEP